MQYRNDSDRDLLLATEPPVMVAPGETVESDDHVAGLTPLGDDGEPEPAGPVHVVAVDQAAAPALPVAPADTDPVGADAPADADDEPEDQR